MTEIVKICKIHGELTLENTYLSKTKIGNLIRMCSICKKGYRNDWAKLNPEKVKLSQEKKRQKRLKELEDGTLKKICKVHGELPIEKIRIDSRGTKVCRNCSNEQANKSHDNPDYKKRQKEWLHSDPERKKRYRQKDAPKRRIRQRKLYAKWKKNPEWKEKYREQSLRSGRKKRKELSDSYVISQLKTIRKGGKNNRHYEYLKDVDVPKEVIELKRLQMKIHREIKLQKRKVRNVD